MAPFNKNNMGLESAEETQMPECLCKPKEEINERLVEIRVKILSLLENENIPNWLYDVGNVFKKIWEEIPDSKRTSRLTRVVYKACALMDKIENHTAPESTSTFKRDEDIEEGKSLLNATLKEINEMLIQ